MEQRSGIRDASRGRRGFGSLGTTRTCTQLLGRRIPRATSLRRWEKQNGERRTSQRRRGRVDLAARGLAKEESGGGTTHDGELTEVVSEGEGCGEEEDGEGVGSAPEERVFGLVGVGCEGEMELALRSSLRRSLRECTI